MQYKKTFLTNFSLGVVLLVVFLLSTTNLAYSFSSYQEIDDYYDSQQKAVEEENARKNKAIEEQLQRDLEAIDVKNQSQIWEMYKRVYGDQFEMVKPFLPESNPDPYYHANNLLGLDRDTALRAIKNIFAVNENLANQVLVIYERESATKKIPPSAKDLFNHIDTLPNDKASETLALIKADNLSLYNEVYGLIMAKYPNGKPGSAMHDDYLESLQTKPSVPIQQPKPITPTPAVQRTIETTEQEEQLDINSNESEASTTDDVITLSQKELDRLVEEKVNQMNEDSAPTPEPKKENFFKRILNRIFSWF